MAESRQPRGTTHWKHKLDVLDVAAIYTSTDKPISLASKYEVSLSNIRAIQKDRSWRHVTSQLNKPVRHTTRGHK